MIYHRRHADRTGLFWVPKNVSTAKKQLSAREPAHSVISCVFLGLGTWFLEWVFFFAFLSLLCKIHTFTSSPMFLIHSYIGVRNHLQKNALLPESELASSGHVLVT